MVILSSGEKIYYSIKPSRRSPSLLKYFLMAFACFALGIALGVSTMFVTVKLPFVSILQVAVVLVLASLFVWIWGELRRITVGHYYLTNYRVVSKRGIFRTKEDSISWNQVTNVRIIQKMTGKLFRIGTIDIRASGAAEDFLLKDIKHPKEVEGLIMDIMSRGSRMQYSEERYEERPQKYRRTAYPEGSRRR